MLLFEELILLKQYLQVGLLNIYFYNYSTMETGFLQHDRRSHFCCLMEEQFLEYLKEFSSVYVIKIQSFLAQIFLWHNQWLCKAIYVCEFLSDIISQNCRLRSSDVKSLFKETKAKGKRQIVEEKFNTFWQHK